MKKKDIVTGTITRIDFPNQGILDTPEGPIKVKNTLPQRNIKVQIQKARKGKFEGRCLEIIEKSPLETLDNVCKHFEICGGCLYASIPYEEEIRIKADQIKRLLSPVIGEEYFNRVYNGIVKSPQENAYRNKMEFSFGDEYKGGPLALGMHKRGAFYDIVTVDDCRIIDDDYKKILLTTLDFFTEKHTPFFNKNTHEGFLRHLLLRKASFTGEILIDLVTASGIEDNLLYEWSDSIKNLELDGTLAGILHTKNDRISDVVFDEGTRVLFGKDYFTETLLGLSFKITPFSFFQTNSYGAEKLYELVNEHISNTGVVYDLYCGTGTIGQIVSKKAKKVIGVEIVKEAVEAARKNAKANEIENAEFIPEDVLKALDNIEEKPDMIILDPPREGVHPKALKKILSYGVEKIIYISCKPTSLARDLEAFKEYSYQVDYIKLVDLFPRTANCETVAILRHI